MHLSLVIPTLNEAGNIGEVIRRAHRVLGELAVDYEILIIDGGSSDGTREEATAAGARALVHEGRGYGAALRCGFANACGEYVVTMDSDLSHEPEFIARLWSGRQPSGVIIASRYVPGGMADMSASRYILSRILNSTFTTILRLPVKDISSGFRLYPRQGLARIDIQADDFDVLEEILIKLYIEGHSVSEVPFHYKPRKEGKSHAKLFKFGMAYLRTLWRMVRLRLGKRNGT